MYGQCHCRVCYFIADSIHFVWLQVAYTQQIYSYNHALNILLHHTLGIPIMSKKGQEMANKLPQQNVLLL